MPSVMLQNSLGKVYALCRESRRNLWLDVWLTNQGGILPLWFNQIRETLMWFLNQYPVLGQRFT